MMQSILVLVIVAAALGWMGWYGYRFLKPKGGKGCAGGCGCGHESGGIKPRAQSEGGGGKYVFAV